MEIGTKLKLLCLLWWKKLKVKLGVGNNNRMGEKMNLFKASDSGSSSDDK